jgi:hypothetical protein
MVIATAGIMPNPRDGQLAFLLAEVSRWQEEGLVDEALTRRIRERYRFALPSPPLSAASALEGALREEEAPEPPRAPTLEEELDAEAERELARERVPAEPTLEQALAEEVAHVVAVEETVLSAREEVATAAAAALASPVEARAAALGPALGSAALALAAPPGDEPRPPSEAERVIEAEVARAASGWRRHLRPFLSENALWLAGGLLVVFGSLYFLRLSWEQLSSLGQRLIVAAGLHLYAGAFFGVGHALARRRGAVAVGRILHAFALAILPLGSLALGELCAALGGVRGWGPPLAVVAALGGLGVQGAFLFLIGGIENRACARSLTAAGLALSALSAAVPTLEQLASPGPLPLLAVPLAFLALAWGLLRLARDRVVVRSSVLLVGGALCGAFAALVARVSFGTPVPPTHHALTLAALAALLLAVDHRLRLRAGNPPRLTALGVALLGAELGALALALLGLVRLGYFDLGARLITLGTAALATAAFAWAAVRHGRSLCTQLAATSGLLTYFFLPAPFAALLLLAQRYLSAALGYADQPLPVAFYGLTFVPYLVLALVLAARLRVRRPDLSLDLQRFLLGIGGLLCLLALAGAGDRRPMLWAWPLYAALAYVGAVLFARPRLIHAGHALVLAAATVLGVELAPRMTWLGPSVLLASAALAASLAALRLRAQPHLLHAAVAALAGALLALVLAPPEKTTALAALGLGTLALVALTLRSSSRLAAQLAALGALATLLVAYACLDSAVGPRGILRWLLAWAGAAFLPLLALRRAEPRSRARQLVVEPATVLAALLLLLALPAALAVRAPLAFLPALSLVALSLLARGAAVPTLAALAVALALGFTVDELGAKTLPALSLSALAAGYLLLGAALLPREPRRRGLALSAVGYLVAGVALLLSLAVVADSDGAVAQSWHGALSAAGAALVALAATICERDRPTRGSFALALLATALGVLALLGLRAGLLSLGAARGSLWHYGSVAAGLGLLWLLAADRLGSRPALSRVSRGAAALSIAVPVIPLTGFLALALLQCGPGGGWTLALTGLEAGLAALGAVALLTAAAWRLRRSVPGLGRELQVAGVVGLALCGFRLVSPAGHLVLPLGLAALALAFTGRREGRGLGWPLALVTLALVASHGHLATPLVALALASGVVVCALGWHGRLAGQRETALALGWSLGGLLAAQSATVWIAALLSTGKHPRAAIAALLALALLASAALIEAIARRLARVERPSLAAPLAVTRHAYGASALLALGAVWGCGARAPGFVVWGAVITLAGVGLALARVGLRERREWALHAALLSLPALYHVLRAHTVLSGAGLWLDAGAILLGSAVVLVAQARCGSVGAPAVARRPLLVAALLWPLAGLALYGALAPAHGALLSFLIALHYLAARRTLEGSIARHLSIAVLLHANLALARAWSALGWSDLMLTTVPLGLTVLCLIQVYRAELGRRGSHVLRALTLTAVYTTGLAQALTALTPIQALVVVPTLCVAGIVAGTLFRVRAYALMGVGFLAADLGLNMVRYGLSSPALGALFLTLLGLLVVATMVVFSLERERILRRYSLILGELRSWD